MELRELIDREKEDINYRSGLYYLRKWYRLRTNISNLNDVEEIDAKILFTALSKLSKEDVAFLAMRYDQPLTSGHLPLQAEHAEQSGMTLTDWKIKHDELHIQLSELIHEIKKPYQEQRTKAIERVYKPIRQPRRD